jgi:hypothetical protein
MPIPPPRTTNFSTLPARHPQVKPVGTVLRAGWLWAKRHAQRLLARRRARPGPAFAAMREFNGPARRYPLERQTRDPQGRWGRRP